MHGTGIIAAITSPIFIAVPTERCVWQTPFGNPVDPDVYLHGRGLTASWGYAATYMIIASSSADRTKSTGNLRVKPD